MASLDHALAGCHQARYGAVFDNQFEAVGEYLLGESGVKRDHMLAIGENDASQGNPV